MIKLTPWLGTILKGGARCEPPGLSLAWGGNFPHTGELAPVRPLPRLALAQSGMAAILSQVSAFSLQAPQTPKEERMIASQRTEQDWEGSHHGFSLGK